MVTMIRIAAVIGEDRELTLQLPPNAPTGEVEVIVQSAKKSNANAPINEREEARRILAAAGYLSTVEYPVVNAVALTEEERIRAGTLAPGSKSSEEILNEIRGDY